MWSASGVELPRSRGTGRTLVAADLLAHADLAAYEAQDDGFTREMKRYLVKQFHHVRRVWCSVTGVTS